MDYTIFKQKAKSSQKASINFYQKTEPETVEQINELKNNGYDVDLAVKTLVKDMHKEVLEK